MHELLQIFKLLETSSQPESVGRSDARLILTHPQLSAILDAGLAYYFAPRGSGGHVLPTLPTTTLTSRNEGLDIAVADFPHGKSTAAFTISLVNNPRARLGIDVNASEHTPSPIKAGLALLPTLLALSPTRGRIVCEPNSLDFSGPAIVSTPLLDSDQLAELTSSRTTTLAYTQLPDLFASITAGLPQLARAKLSPIRLEVAHPKQAGEPLGLMLIPSSGIFSLLTVSLHNDSTTPDGVSAHSHLLVNPGVRFASNPHCGEVITRITHLLDSLAVPLARQLLATSASLDTPPTLHLTPQGIALSLPS